MSNQKPEKKELLILMTAGCLLGILCFAMVYGFKIVNFTYDGWIFHGDMDLRQHYNGFCHFRNSDWHFPIGLIDSLSVPYQMSVVYTDSIPLLAIIFKLFRNVLPIHFQYFGLFGLISFALMGMLSPVLIRRFVKSKIVCIFGSLFFILSFTVLQRMYYHTALSAQWIIILALIIWFYTDITDEADIKKICIYWTIIGILTVGIHSYFVFMTGIILAAQTVDGLIISCDRFTDVKKHLKQLLPLVCMGISSFAFLYILGGFYGAGSVSGDGFGSFNGNLSAFVNPLEYSSIFKGFELNGMFEFEGFAYLGAGILLLCALAIALSVYSKKISNGGEEQQMNKDTCIRFSTKIVLLFTAVLSFLFACFPSFSFGRFKIITIPLPGFIKSIFGICRTNARFVWIAMYIIIAVAIWSVGRYYEKTFVKLLFAAAVIIQLFEISSYAKMTNEKYSIDRKFETVWMDLEDENIIDGKDEFVFMYDENDIMMDTAFYAYLNNMSQNSFYYARTIYDEIDENIAQWSEKFLNEELSDNVVYVFRDEDYTTDFSDIVKKTGANEYKASGHVIITAK